jgi:hypothetical protein
MVSLVLDGVGVWVVREGAASSANRNSNINSQHHAPWKTMANITMESNSQHHHGKQ